MNNRDYYKVSYNTDSDKSMDSQEILDNEPEFNANQFKLFDDFTTDLRISFNPLRHNYHDITRRARRDESGLDLANGNRLDDSTASHDADLLENEVMVDPWSSMDSSNSPLTDSGPSASEDCTPSTSSDLPRGSLDISPLSPETRRIPNPKDTDPKTSKHVSSKALDKARSRDLTLDLETLEPDPLPRRPHFLDEDYQLPSKSNIECRIPKPHFLDHSPSPDEFDERSDITNPNFLDDEVDGDENQAQKKSGALPKRPQKSSSSAYSPHEDRPHRTSYRSALHYGLENAARSSERDKRASQLYRGTWPGERDVWMGHDSSSVRSFSSNGSADGTRTSSNLENKMECVCSLISLLSLSPENNADLSAPLLEMSRTVENCIAMRQAGCIPLLVQLIHSKVPRETRDRAAKALRNIIHTQTDDKAGRREARVWRLLEQVREYCHILEDLVEARKDGKEVIEDDATKHPSQSVAALMKLSFDEEHRHVVCQLGGLQALAALVSGDQAAHGSRTDDNTCLTMRKYAGMTLTNLTFGDGNNKSLLCSFKDFMLALVEQLESPNDDMRQVTAAVLRNLSWRADTNSKQVLREVGAVKGLTKAAMTCQKEATLKSVLSALWNLTAHCSMNKVALCSVDGALGFLVDMLSYNSPTKTLAIVENAGGIMRNVSSHIAVREDYRQILRERNCLGVLLQHLKSPSLTVVSNSCGTLWNLSARCPQDQQFLWDHGAVPMLRSLIHSKHKMIAMGSGAALKNLLNSKPGKTHIISLDTTARSLNLPALPTLNARKQKALEQELDQNLAETCDNIEPATSPTTTNRDEKNLFTATERQIAMNLERHRMTSSSPLMGTLASQISLSHSAHLASYLSCSNTLLKGALGPRATGSAGNVNRSDSKDSVTSTHSDSVFERGMRPGKVPVPTPRNKDLVKADNGDSYRATEPLAKGGAFVRYSTQPPVPTPRSTTDMRTNYTESGFDVDQDSCDQPIDYSRKYSETKTCETEGEKPKAETKKYAKKESPSYGDYQETDLDQPTDYSLRYAEHQSEAGSDSEPPRHSVHEDTIKHFATEGTPYETPVIFSTATSMSDLRIIGKDKPKTSSGTKENPEVMSHSDEKDTCSIEEPPRHDNDLAATTPSTSVKRVFDTKFSSGLASPEKPVNYCDEGTPGCFSRVSSLSSLAEPTEEDNLAKRNAMATITVHPSPPEHTASLSKDKEGCKAVTFASEPVEEARYIEDTPLMFSRCSSLGSLPDCDQPDDQGSVVSDRSRMTSGCISPSEIPDSPGVVSPRGRATRALSTPSAPCSPPDPPSPADNAEGVCPGSVFEERTSQFVVEHTPAQFSRNTSLSSLTIDCDGEEPLPKLPIEKQEVTDAENIHKHSQNIDNRLSLQSSQSNVISNDTPKEPATPGEVCKVYFTEDTPAILSKAGSNSNLSALSIESGPPPPLRLPPAGAGHDSSDSSNLSDAGDLLEECIQKGIAKVVKNKGPPSEPSSMIPYRDDVYRSLPPYLRSSTETVKMSHEFARNVRDSRSASSSLSPPPLVARGAIGAAPPRPARLPDRSGSGSSLSLDSFGSTDREIFEETVQAGAGVRRPRASTGAARERRRTSPSSLSDASFGSTDKEVFERSVRAGMPRARSHDRLERRRRRPRRSRPAPAPAPPQPPPRESKNVPEPSAERAPAGGSAPSARPLTGSDSPLSNEELAPPPPAEAGRNPDERDDLDRSNESYADVVDAWSETAAPRAPLAPLTDLRLPTDDTDTWNEDTVPDDVTFPTLSGSLAALERSAGPGTGALPDLLESGSGAPRPPDVTARLAPLALDSLATREIEREAARLAARLRALHAATAPDPPSLLDSVKPPSELDRLDMEGSMVSVASLASESGGAPLTFDLRQPVREFPLCSSAAFTLVDLDRVDPPSLFDELHESTLDVDPAPAPTTPPGQPAPTTPPGPTEPESEPEQPRRHLTPKERRLADADRYQTYTICDVPPAPAPVPADDPFVTWTETTARAAGDESPPTPGDDEATRPRRRPSARQRRAEDRARYRTQAVDVSVLPPPPADSELESLRRRLDDKRTSRQRRLDDADRYRTRTLVEDALPAPAPASPGDAENADTTTGYDSLSSNERHQLADELPAPPAAHQADCDPSSGGYGSYEADEPPSPPPEPRPRPKIVAPPARDDSLESVESAEEAPKAIRGRRKTPYVSPYRRSAPPPAAPRRPAPRPVSTPAATRVAAARAPASTASRPVSTNTSPKKSLPVRSPSKSASTKAGTNVTPRPLPLERQGTFTKEESSVPATALPGVEAKPATARRLGKSAPPAKIPPTSPSRLPQPRGAGTGAARAPPSSKTPTKVTKMRPSASNHSLQSDDSGRTVTLARSSRQGSASSVASVSSRTKDVESKIANLWKKVEQAKKQPAKPDRRVWIEAETPRLVRSSTFEGQPVAPHPGKPKQKSAIGMRVSQIPAPRARSTPAPKASTAPAPPSSTTRRTTLARVFTRKPLNSQAT